MYKTYILTCKITYFTILWNTLQYYTSCTISRIYHTFFQIQNWAINMDSEAIQPEFESWFCFSWGFQQIIYLPLGFFSSKIGMTMTPTFLEYSESQLIAYLSSAWHSVWRTRRGRCWRSTIITSRVLKRNLEVVIWTSRTVRIQD